MATVHQSQHLDEDFDDDLYSPKPGHTLPGYTVDALLEQGKVEEARVELERLLQEGIDSGPSAESADQIMTRLRSQIHARAALHR